MSLPDALFTPSLKEILGSVNDRLAVQSALKASTVAMEPGKTFEEVMQYFKEFPTLTVEEEIWYKYIPVILRGVSILLRGTVAGNVADLLTQLKGADLQTKPWYVSKTIWVNVLSMLWLFVGKYFGAPEPTPEITILWFGIVNLVLRAVTKTEVTVS